MVNNFQPFLQQAQTNNFTYLLFFFFKTVATEQLANNLITFFFNTCRSQCVLEGVKRCNLELQMLSGGGARHQNWLIFNHIFQIMWLLNGLVLILHSSSQTVKLLYTTFLRPKCFLFNSHTMMRTSEINWGSVSFPKTFWCADSSSLGSNHQPFD